MQEESRRKPISGCVFMCAWMRALTPPDFAPSLQTSGSGQTHSDQTKSHSRQAHLRSPLLSSVRDLYFCQSFYSSFSPSLCWLQFLLSLSFPTVSSLVFLLCVCVCVCVCLMHSLNYVENFLHSTFQWKMWTLQSVCVRLCSFSLTV